MRLADGDDAGALALGDGAPYAPILKNIGAGLSAQGQKVTYQELAPYTADDPAGSGLSTIALPLVFGGAASTMIMGNLIGKRRPWAGALGSLTLAVVAGFVVTAILQFGFHSIDGNYFLAAGCLSFGILAIALPLMGLLTAFGMPGFGVGAAGMLFFANPLAGFATGPQWLPAPWGTLGQLLPNGAAGTVLRSAAYFDGQGMGHSLVILACWTLLGLVLLTFASRRKSRANAAQTEPVTA